MLMFSLSPTLGVLGAVGVACAVGIVVLVLTAERPMFLTDQANQRARDLTRKLRLRLWWQEEKDTVYTGLAVIAFSVFVFTVSVNLVAMLVQAYL